MKPNDLKRIREHLRLTQQQLADAIGKSRSHIANTLRLLTLPEDIRKHIETGSLTAGHARALIAADSPLALADQIIKLGLNVRETEKLSRGEGAARKRPASRTSDPNIRAVETSLLEALGLKVEITEAGKNGGRITIHFSTLEQLEDVFHRLLKPAA